MRNAAMSNWLQPFVTFASAVSATVLNALWQDALIVLCVWLLLRAWPQVNAATRYAVWSATLVAALVVPVATTLAYFAPPRTLATASAALPAAALRPGIANQLSRAAHSSTPVVSSRETARLPGRLRVTLSAQLAIAVFVIWIALAIYALVRLAIGLVRLEQLKRDALPLPVEYRDSMPQWLRANKGTRDVRLCVSDETDVPVAVGLFDAMILVPRSLLERLSETEVDQISLHELAHLRRGDDWSNGFQRIAVALFGWNPAILFVSQQLDLEREVACDDWVLASTGLVRPYAACLAKMAETSSWPYRPMPAPGVFATRKHISLRIERLLGAGRNAATSLSFGPAAVTVAIVGGLAFAMQMVAPSVAASISNVPEVPVAHATAAPAVHSNAKPQQREAKTTKEIVKYERVLVAMDSPAPTESSPPAPNAPQMHVHIPMRAIVVPTPGSPHGQTTYVIPPLDVEMPAIARNATQAATQAAAQAAAEADSMAKSVSAATAHAVTHGMRVADAGSVRKCNGCDMSGSNFAGRDMSYVDFTGSDLSHSNLVGTNFYGGTFNGVDFSGSKLRGASFRNARLTGCDFSNADLTGADFTGATLTGCQFTGAVLTSAEIRSIMRTCTGCDFSRASLGGVDLSHVRVSGVDFSGANLSGANLTGAEFTGVDFSHARLNGATLTDTTFSSCDLSGVDLTHNDLSRTRFIGTEFSMHGSPEP